MTPLPVIESTFRVAINWTNDANDQQSENVLHFRAPGLDAADVGAALDAAFTANMWLPLPSTWGADTFSITPLDGGSATLNWVSGSAHGTGGTAGPWSPSSALVVSLGTPLRGRSYRGRVFLGPVADGAIANGAVTAAMASDVAAAWNAFNAAVTSSGVDFGVASYKHAVFSQLTTATVKAAIGTQRRRQTRVRYP